MPLTEFQREVFRVLRQNRSPDSVVMGATVINAADGSSRFLQYLDLSHDLVHRLPAGELGCLYLDDRSKVVESDLEAIRFHDLKRHFGSPGDAWPRIAG